MKARLQEGDPGIVIDLLGMHGLDETELVGDFCGVGQEFADPGAALAMARELVNGLGEGEARLRRGHRGEALALAHAGREFLAVALGERGLVVEGLHLRRPAEHEEIDDALGLGGKVGVGEESFGGGGGEEVTAREHG